MQTMKSHSPKLTTLILLLACWTLPCSAGDIYVTITADTNDGFCGGPLHLPCSLRDAIILSNNRAGEDTIHVPAGTYYLSISGTGEDAAATGDLDITEDLTIIGSESGATVVHAQGTDRVFHVLHSGSTDFQNLSIRGGLANIGAGIAAHFPGLVLVAHCTIEGNVGTEPEFGGGGIYAEGPTVSVLDSTIRDNEATMGSAIFTYGSTYLVINRSTISDNYSRNADLFPGIGGGAVVIASSNAGIINSTFTGNQNQLDDFGGGLTVATGEVWVDSCTFADNDGFDIYDDPPATVWLRNTIIRGRCGGTNIVTEGGNIEGPGDTCGLLDPGDHLSSHVYLLPLNDYGGPTFTMPPEERPDNLAIDNDWAEANCLTQDQRGVSRPRDGDDDLVSICDSGAVEILGVLQLVHVFSDGFESGDTSKWSGAVE